jgi:hypothetical protein
VLLPGKWLEVGEGGGGLSFLSIGVKGSLSI